MTQIPDETGVLLLLAVVVWVFYVLFTLVHAVSLLDEEVSLLQFPLCASRLIAALKDSSGEQVCSKPGVHFLFGNIFWYTLAAIAQGFLIGAARGAIVWFLEIPPHMDILIVSVHTTIIFLMLVWGLFLWFTTSEECSDLYVEKFFHLWLIFKVYVIWQVIALGALGYELHQARPKNLSPEP